SAFRLWVWTALAITLVLNAWTIRQTASAVSNVLWADQWSFTAELAEYLGGGSGWSILWRLYWGNRSVITRLLFLADAKLFALANAPLVALIFALQVIQAALFIYIAGRLFGAFRSVKLVLAAVATLHLMFSSLQMENFVWGLPVQFASVHL